jgi:hypothetical protein
MGDGGYRAAREAALEAEDRAVGQEAFGEMPYLGDIDPEAGCRPVAAAAAAAATAVAPPAVKIQVAQPEEGLAVPLAMPGRLNPQLERVLTILGIEVVRVEVWGQTYTVPIACVPESIAAVKASLRHQGPPLEQRVCRIPVAQVVVPDTQPRVDRVTGLVYEALGIVTADTAVEGAGIQTILADRMSCVLGRLAAGGGPLPVGQRAAQVALADYTVGHPSPAMLFLAHLYGARYVRVQAAQGGTPYWVLAGPRLAETLGRLGLYA